MDINLSFSPCFIVLFLHFLCYNEDVTFSYMWWIPTRIVVGADKARSVSCTVFS